MSYPKKVKLFVPWTKAMVEGATVGEPDYGKRHSKNTAKKKRKRRRRRRKKMTNGKET